MSVVNLEGFIFGKLTVLNLNRVDKHYGAFWNCQCLCGSNPIVVRADHLKSGNTKSCECKKETRSSKVNTKIKKDIVNIKFGNLLATKIHHKDKKYNSYWLCECDCGNICVVRIDYLTSFKKTSCGNCNNNLKDMIFEKLTVVKAEGRNKRGERLWLCVCECGNEIITKENSLISGHTTTCGSHTESKLASDLKKYLKDKYKAIPEYKILRNPTTNSWLPYDIYIPEENIFIEINGKHHYVYLPYWHKNKEGFEYQKQKDKIKRKFAKRNGIYVEIDLRKIKNIDQALKYISECIK